MDDTKVIQLITLWFVILIYIQTGSESSGPVVTAIDILAILLVYIIPLTVIGYFVWQLLGE